MELDKPSRYLRALVFLLGSIIIFEIGSVKSSDIKQFSSSEEKTAMDFENAFLKYTNPFEKYDSYSNQFDNFFGINYIEAEDKRNFQDLSVSTDSKKIRDLYEDMLEEITTIQKFKIDKEPLYKKKI